MLVLEFAGFFLFILVFGYLLPAGHLYFRYHIRRDRRDANLLIQQRRPAPGQIRREIKLSLLTISIFAVMSTGLLELYKAGHTSIYRNFHAYPLYYLPASLVIALFIHDAYFYWLHRFMHWRPVFKYLHLGHHLSVSPTPFAIFAFQPLEAVLQFCGVSGLVIFLPMHPIVLLGFLWYDTLINTSGHTGYEMVPKSVWRSWFYTGFNTVTHHDTHHTNMKVNFGAFFNIWDRWMGTFLDETTPHENKSSRNAALETSPAMPAPMRSVAANSQLSTHRCEETASAGHFNRPFHHSDL